MSQLSQLAGLTAGLSIPTSFFVVIVMALGAYALVLVLTIRFLRSRLEKDGSMQSGDDSR